jgi:hypothetical protein
VVNELLVRCRCSTVGSDKMRKLCERDEAACLLSALACCSLCKRVWSVYSGAEASSCLRCNED